MLLLLVSSLAKAAASLLRRKINASRNQDLKQLMADGFGMHNAGMLRKDRNLAEASGALLMPLALALALALALVLVPVLVLLPRTAVRMTTTAFAACCCHVFALLFFVGLPVCPCLCVAVP